MTSTKNTILQMTDLVSRRWCALRIDSQDVSLPLDSLLQKYLKDPPLERLQRERRITDESVEVLASLQDLVYLSSDEGQLRAMFSGVAFMQNSQALELDEAPHANLVRLEDKEALLIDLEIDRTNVSYDRNWVGFNKRRWSRHADTYSAFVLSCLERECGQAAAAAVLEMGSVENKLRLVEVLAKRIWASDFESYSRFTGHKLVYKWGDETVRNIIEGAGGICSEKVQALKFLTDHYGLESEFILAGRDVPNSVPEARLRDLLTTFDFRFAKRYMRYWQHTALFYSIDGTSVLVDATNGNIPFLFLKDSAAQQLLAYESKPSIRVKMAVSEEDFYYHRVSQDIPRDLFFAMEGWIPYIDLVQVFDNELGLYISKDFMVTSIIFKSGKNFDKIHREYLRVCEGAGLQYEATAEWGLESPLGQRFAEQEPEVAEKVLLAKDHLLVRYNGCHGPGHQAGLVVIGLRNKD